MAIFPLRLARSRSIWEDGSTEEIVRKEFPAKGGGVDLRPSVYLVERDEVPQARAEHLVGISPPVAQGCVDLDLSELATVAPSRGTGTFVFTRDRHAELLVEDEASLHAVANAVREDAHRRIPRSRGDVMRYVADRVGAEDPEWCAFMAAQPKWREVLDRWVRQQPPPR